MSARVIFFPVKDPNVKLQKVVRAARFHFAKRERILFQVADEKAAKFLDELMWKMPAYGFLPHAISHHETDDYVVITDSKKNLNNSKYVFNLCPSPILAEDTFRLIYELEDMSTPNKLMLSRKRFEAYRSLKYIIESR